MRILVWLGRRVREYACRIVKIMTTGTRVFCLHCIPGLQKFVCYDIIQKTFACINRFLLGCTIRISPDEACETRNGIS